MSRPTLSHMRAALWEAIVARTEALNDAAVLGQRAALPRTAQKLADLASDVAALARSAALLSQREGKQP